MLMGALTGGSPVSCRWTSYLHKNRESVGEVALKRPFVILTVYSFSLQLRKQMEVVVVLADLAKRCLKKVIIL